MATSIVPRRHRLRHQPQRLKPAPGGRSIKSSAVPMPARIRLGAHAKLRSTHSQIRTAFWGTTIAVRIEFDSAKLGKALRERNLAFKRAAGAFAGHHSTARDERQDHGEERCVTAGLLDGRMVVAAWTSRPSDRRIIGTRKANDREQTHHAQRPVDRMMHRNPTTRSSSARTIAAAAGGRAWRRPPHIGRAQTRREAAA